MKTMKIEDIREQNIKNEKIRKLFENYRKENKNIRREIAIVRRQISYTRLDLSKLEDRNRQNPFKFFNESKEDLERNITTNLKYVDELKRLIIRQKIEDAGYKRTKIGFREYSKIHRDELLKQWKLVLELRIIPDKNILTTEDCEHLNKISLELDQVLSNDIEEREDNSKRNTDFNIETEISNYRQQIIQMRLDIRKIENEDEQLPRKYKHDHLIRDLNIRIRNNLNYIDKIENLIYKA